MNGPNTWQGNYVSGAGGEMLDAYVADITLTYPQLQPEATYALMDAYRTGRTVDLVQDLNALAAENVNWLNSSYNKNYAPSRRQSAEEVYLNVALLGVPLAK